jgi:hypothetical protein
VPPFSTPWPNTVAERLMIPGLSHRIIEALLLSHATYLKKMGIYSSFAEIRKLSGELGYERVIQNASNEQQENTQSSKDPYIVTTVCSYCQSPLKASQTACSQCKKARSPCPICLSTQGHADTPKPSSSLPLLQPTSLWTFCHACAHSAHTACMQTWLSDAYSQGACPTTGCTCDCAPGEVRSARLQKQSEARDELNLIRGSVSRGDSGRRSPGGGGGGSGNGPKRDQLKAVQSPAVDKARTMLRAGSGERGSQSGDERSLPQRQGQSGVRRGRAGHRQSSAGRGRDSSRNRNTAGTATTTAAAAASGGAGVGGSGSGGSRGAGAERGGNSGSGASTGSGMARSAKSVRLMAPGEERGGPAT